MTLLRRDLLRLGAAGVALPLLGACRDPKRAEPPVALQDVGGDAAPSLEVHDAESELLAGSTRYAFGLVDDDGPVIADRVTVYAGREPAEPATTTVSARRLTEEIDRRGLYVATLDFPAAGDYFVAVVATLPDGTRAKGGTRVAVTATSKSPAPGARVPAIPTPTTAAPLGADPLCSRRPTPCSMHAMSLDAALRSGRPSVVVFAAPAFCRTELCGPGVEIVQRIATREAGRANFLHVEAYRKKGTVLAPALQSFKFETEPWIYFVDARGVVVDRISGAFGSDEVVERLDRLGS